MVSVQFSIEAPVDHWGMMCRGAIFHIALVQCYDGISFGVTYCRTFVLV